MSDPREEGLAPAPLRLLEYLREHRSITPLEAWTELGIYRLAARVLELREAGFRVVTTRQTEVNRWGEKMHFGRYSLWQTPRTRNRT